MEIHRFKRLSRADRYDIQILGNITLEQEGEKQESYICNTVNVSLSGALVETSSLIPVGSLLQYTFRMPGFSVPVNVIGEVVRGVKAAPAPAAGEKAKAKAKGPKKTKKAGVQEPDSPAADKKLNRYGIIFLDLSEQDKLALEIFLVQNRKRTQHMLEPEDPELS
ncbi:MAG: PilZ domain-containing protein [Thermodesulfobacteriota bacterium]